MEENEVIAEKDEEAAAEAAETEEVSAAEAEAAEKEEIYTEEGAEANENAEISAENFAKTLANPMFAVFARGRSGSIEEAILDFEKMIAAGRSTLSEEELMKMTPGAYSAASGTVLSERQRRIARDAGMSYREYYEIIRSIPTKTK